MAGSIHSPYESDIQLFSICQRSNNVVGSWLLDCISKEITVSVVYSNSAAELWSDLREIFQQKNGPGIFSIEERIYGATTKVHLLWVNISQKLKDSWDEQVPSESSLTS